MRVVLYRRRSTNAELQGDSLAAQDELLRAYAAEQGHVVVGDFADSASGRSVTGRDAFLRLIAAVRKGADFEGVLVADVSRWGRFENTDEAAFYEFLCLTHGVQIIYVQEIFGSSPLAPLLKAAKRWMAAEFSRERSRMVSRTQARVVQRGFMHGGPAPYGLRRTLVTLDGNYIGELQPGDRKALGNMRVKLAPGAAEEIAVIQRIFREYGDEGRTIAEIGEGLARDGYRGRFGGHWQAATVAYVLRNEVYAGRSHYHRRTKRTRSELRDTADDPHDDRNVRSDQSFEPIVDAELWQRVQQRLAASTWRKSNLVLADEIRIAFEKWGYVEHAMLDPRTSFAHWQTYINRFRGGYTEALETAYAREVEAAKAALRDLLGGVFGIEEFAGGWLLDTMLHVGFKTAWPRARRGSLFWEFSFEGDEVEDVTVGFGFSPPPEVRAVETFFFVTSKMGRKRRSIYRKLTAKPAPRRFGIGTPPEVVVRHFESAFHFRSTRGEKAFLAAVADLPMVNLAALARQLGWQTGPTRIMYDKLVARGAAVPPLRRRKDRRLDVICSKCSGVRRLVPSQALNLASDICGECRHLWPSRKQTVTCRECGAERQYAPSVVTAMKEGLSSLCHSCALEKGRAVRRQWYRNRREIEATKRRALLPIAEAVLDAMSGSADFIGPILWTRGKRRWPTLRWRDAASGQKLRLALGCADDAVESLLGGHLPRVDVVLDRQAWREVRCDGRNDHAFVVMVEPQT